MLNEENNRRKHCEKHLHATPNRAPEHQIRVNCRKNANVESKTNEKTITHTQESPKKNIFTR